MRDGPLPASGRPDLNRRPLDPQSSVLRARGGALAPAVIAEWRRAYGRPTTRFRGQHADPTHMPGENPTAESDARTSYGRTTQGDHGRGAPWSGASDVDTTDSPPTARASGGVTAGFTEVAHDLTCAANVARCFRRTANATAPTSALLDLFGLPRRESATTVTDDHGRSDRSSKPDSQLHGYGHPAVRGRWQHHL